MHQRRSRFLRLRCYDRPTEAATDGSQKREGKTAAHYPIHQADQARPGGVGFRAEATGTMNARCIYRVQDKEGRGPFRPGMSARWVQEDGPDQLPPVMVEFGNEIINKLHRKIDEFGGACGCGCADRDGLNRWFTRLERRRLKRLGYQVVMMDIDEVIAESPNQIVFWRWRSLDRHFIVIPW